MAFTIPNESGSLASPDQAEVDSVDLDILAAAMGGVGVVSGCLVTAQGTPDTTVAVASGVIRIGGLRVAVSGGNVTPTADPTNPRFVLVCANNAGARTVALGTPSATNPVFPPIPANSVVLAAVYVPAADTAITSNQIVDKRVIVDFAPTSFVFITNVTGAGTITGKTYEANTVPANKVLTAFTSDDDSITVALEIHAAIDSWMPDSVTVSGGGATPVTSLRQAWTQVGSSRIWTASVTLSDAGTSGTITAVMSDGDTASATYTRALDPPLVLTAIFNTHPLNTGGDPNCQYAQTQTSSVTGTQTLRITGTTQSHATKIWVRAAGVSSIEQGPFDVIAGAFDITMNVRSSGGASATATASLECAVGTGGTRGAPFTTTNTVDLDHTVPTFGSVSIAYPATQEALKDAEACDITLAHTNAAAGDTYVYDTASTGELTIPSPTVYASPKNGVTRLAGNYRETGTNYRLTATRTTKNGAATVATATVKIAHTAPVVTVARDTGGSALLRLGTDNGTNHYLDVTVWLNSSQANLSTHTPVLTAPKGTWQGAWAASGIQQYTRSLRIADADILPGGQAANNYSWTSCSVKNRAGKETVAITTNPNYALGGFATRTLNMGPATGGDPPYTHTADIGVPVVDTSKCTVVNTSKGGTPTQTYEASVTEHNDADSSLNNYWTTVAALASESFDDYTKYFHCSDKRFYDSVSAPGGFNVTIAESA